METTMNKRNLKKPWVMALIWAAIIALAIWPFPVW
jgi:hypothetical protein